MILSLTTCVCQAQVFHLEQVADTAAMLVLTTDTMRSEWKIDYPVYRFQQCDIDGDGTREAVVGVVKPTRFDRSLARRVFIFKNFRGWIRPMWMGSSLGHELIDFRCTGGRVRAALRNRKGDCGVGDYAWDKFGLSFVEWIERDITQQHALDLLNDISEKDKE